MGSPSPNTYTGITIDQQADFVQIVNPMSGQCGILSKPPYSQTNMQSYGLLDLVSNASQHFMLEGGQFDGNLTAAWGADDRRHQPRRYRDTVTIMAATAKVMMFPASVGGLNGRDALRQHAA